MTTDEMDRITPEERMALVGYCEHDRQWYKFTDSLDKIASRKCPECGGHFSSKTGYQITTQRTFDPTAKRMTKAQLKKMSSGA